MSRDLATLVDIYEAAISARKFINGFDLDTFLKDEKTQSAVLHQLTVLGEAVNRLSNEFTETHHEIPWRLMAATRNRLVHGYDSVDLHEVWNIIGRDLPELLEQITLLLPDR